MINDHENEAENEKQITKIQHRPRSRYGHNYTKYKTVSQFNDAYVY